MLFDKILRFCKENPEPCNQDAFKSFLTSNSLAVNFVDLNGASLLLCASSFDRLDLLEYILADEQTGELRGCFKKTDLTEALFEACLNGCKRNVQLLVDLGADVNGVGTKNKTPLHNAALGHSDYLVGTLKALKKPEEKTHTENEAHDEDEIISDINFRKIDIIELLLRNGAKINAKDDNGRTPLHLASKLDFVNKVQTLIDGGADVHALDSKNRTPLHYASNQNVSSHLLYNGAKINAKDIDGKTPLHSIVEKSNDVNSADFLIYKGADVFAVFKDDKGVYKTALDIVPEGKEHDELRKLLKDNQTNKAYFKHIANETAEFLSSHLLAVACVAAVGIGVALYVRGASVSLPSGVLKDMLNSADKTKSLMI